MALEMTIGKLAKVVGVNIDTIRYYERLKLLAPAARKPSGYRLYGDDNLRRLRFIKNAQALGFTLHEVRELLSLRVSSTARCGDVQEKAQTKLNQVKEKIRDLQALDRTLLQLVRACRSGQTTDHCPILQSFEGERRGNDGKRNTTR
jgi:MerR family transcriptional regulator, copper efflux regulator